MDVDSIVVGGGIAGLATAYRLQQQGRSVLVLEAAPEVGGRMSCYRRDGFVVDLAAGTLGPYGYDATWALIRELAIEGEVERMPRARVAIRRGGRQYPWVGHPLAFLLSGGLSVSGRAGVVRMLLPALWNRRRYRMEHPEETPAGDRSVAEACRTYGEEVLEYVVEPAASGGFGWTPEEAAMGPLVASGLAHRGFVKWLTYRDGMDTLARALAARLTVRVHAPVDEVAPVDGGVRVTLRDSSELHARTCVLAVPAPVARALHPAMPEDERGFVEASTYEPLVRVNLLLARPLLEDRRLYVVLFPRREGTGLVAATIEHNKHPNRAPAGKGLLTLIGSPARSAEILDASDEEATRALAGPAEQAFPGLAEATTDSVVYRLRHGTPTSTCEALVLRPPFARRPARAIEYAGDWVYMAANSEIAVRTSLLAARRLAARSEAQRPRERGVAQPAR